jgi:hypothetical protein
LWWAKHDGWFLMVASYVGVNADTTESFPTTSATISSFASGHAAGNLMMLHIRTKRSNKTTPTFTVDQGFTQTTRATTTANNDAIVNEIWFKTAEGTAGTEPQPTITVSDSAATGAAFGASIYEFASTTETYLVTPQGESSPTGSGTGDFTPSSDTITKDGLALVAFVNGSTPVVPSTVTAQGFTSARTYSATIYGQVLYKTVSASTITWPTWRRGSTIDATNSITLVFGVLSGGWSVGRISF